MKKITSLLNETKSKRHTERHCMQLSNYWELDSNIILIATQIIEGTSYDTIKYVSNKQATRCKQI